MFPKPKKEACLRISCIAFVLRSNQHHNELEYQSLEEASSLRERVDPCRTNTIGCFIHVLGVMVIRSSSSKLKCCKVPS